MMKKLVKNRDMHDQLQLLAAILAQWRHLVASNKALNLLHRAMCTVTYRRIAMAIKMASFCRLYCSGAPPWPSKQLEDKVHLFVIVDFVINNNHSQRPCYGLLKLKLRHSKIYHSVISLLLCFGHPPMTMDVVMATTVTGGQANIN